jgi:hypothetical protein
MCQVNGTGERIDNAIDARQHLLWLRVDSVDVIVIRLFSL